MKRLLMLIPLVFLCCFGCQQGEEVATADVEADIQVIKDKIIKEREAGINTANFDKLMSFYSDDTIEILPNKPPLIGKKAILNENQRIFDEVTPQEKDVIKTVHVSCDLAVAYVAWSWRMTPKVGGEQFEQNGNWITIFQRQKDVTWKCIYSMWSNESYISPPIPE